MATLTTTIETACRNPYAWTRPHSGNTTAKGFRYWMDAVYAEALPLRVSHIEHRATTFSYWYVTEVTTKGFTIQVSKHIDTATFILWPKKSELDHGTHGFNFNGFIFAVDPDAALDGRCLPAEGARLGDGTQHEEDNRNRPACDCDTDPFTWIVSDPLDGMVVCFGCRTCGTTWTRIAPEPMQKLHRKRMEAAAEKELAEMGWTA